MDADGNILVDSGEEYYNSSDTDSAFGSARLVVRRIDRCSSLHGNEGPYPTCRNLDLLATMVLIGRDILENN